jgi:hypothetical protein
MAIRTETLNIVIPTARAESAGRLAALPTGSIVAVFDSHTEAVRTAVQLSMENGEGLVWVATGAQAAIEIRATRARRSFFQKLAGALSDDEVFVDHILDEAEHDRTVLVVRPNNARDALSCLAGARHVIGFGRWTTSRIR